jgi:hypothetical protein
MEVSSQLHTSATATAQLHPLYRRLGGPQIWSGHYGEEKNLLFILGIEPRLLSHPAHSLVAIQTEVSVISMFCFEAKQQVFVLVLMWLCS